MTIIALVQTKDGFDCYADSLVSFTGATRLNIYCKVLIVPVSYRFTVSGRTVALDHKFGMAISGNLAAATAVYTILSGVLQSLHSHDTRSPPRIEDIVKLTARIAAEVYDDVRALGENGLFGFFLFGHDIEERKPFAYQISTDLSDTGKYEISVRNSAQGEGKIALLGSGSDSFRQTLAENDGHGPRFPDLFYKFVTSGIVATVGGMPQVLLARSKAVTIEPVIIGTDDGLNATVYHSGLNVDGYKTVGDYMVGFEIRGFNMDRVHTVEALKQAGYDPVVDDPPVGKVNQALVQWRLGIDSQYGEKVNYHGVMPISKPDRIGEDKYLSYECRNCKEYSRILQRVPRLKSKPFRDDLDFIIKCDACDQEFTSRANSFLMKPFNE